VDRTTVLKIILKIIRYEVVVWISLTEDKDHWRYCELVNERPSCTKSDGFPEQESDHQLLKKRLLHEINQCRLFNT